MGRAGVGRGHHAPRVPLQDGDRSYPTTWTQIANSAPGGANQKGYTVGSLTNEVVHTFQLRAVNTTGNGLAAEADPVTPTPASATGRRRSRR